MKESKTSENINKDELVENTEKKFEKDLNEIKEKLNVEKLSDEFKENLQAKLEKELNGTTSNDNGKIIKFPVITRKLAGICACFVFLCTSCIAFADEIENVIFNIFSNTDKIVERAIANGNYREIDMEYVEDNGISIKVDYIVAEDDNLYIAFNVLSEEEFDNILISQMDIRNQNRQLLYTKGTIGESITLGLDGQSISKKNAIVIYKLANIKNSEEEINELKINIEKIYFHKENDDINKIGKWELNVNM